MTEPTFTVQETAVRLGVDPGMLAAFIEQELPDMLADGTAHYADDGTLVIDGGEE